MNCCSLHVNFKTSAFSTEEPSSMPILSTQLTVHHTLVYRTQYSIHYRLILKSPSIFTSYWGTKVYTSYYTARHNREDYTWLINIYTHVTHAHKAHSLLDHMGDYRIYSLLELHIPIYYIPYFFDYFQVFNISLVFWAIQINNSWSMNNSQVPYHCYCIDWKSKLLSKHSTVTWLSV